MGVSEEEVSSNCLNHFHPSFYLFIFRSATPSPRSTAGGGGGVSTGGGRGNSFRHRPSYSGCGGGAPHSPTPTAAATAPMNSSENLEYSRCGSKQSLLDSTSHRSHRLSNVGVEQQGNKTPGSSAHTKHISIYEHQNIFILFQIPHLPTIKILITM